ncbi:hypothetical protein [Flavobacterium psychraquaticum]|uniref:hypothetical protein n=1 Tax=Flavobacterium psychraquaticum TaxID=3103958 RepID=UPI002ACDA37F|nr:hypothetical protein [Flavobacterium sp. LB-N7T]
MSPYKSNIYVITVENLESDFKKNPLDISLNEKIETTLAIISLAQAAPATPNCSKVLNDLKVRVLLLQSEFFSKI